MLDNGGNGAEKYSVKLINGRIGYRGVTHFKSFATLDKATSFFQSKFFEKTHLNWDERDDEPVPNKYVVVELANNAKEVKKEEPEEPVEPPKPVEPEPKTRGRKKKILEVKKEEPEEEDEKDEVHQKVKDLMKCICDEDVHLGLLKQLKFNEAYGKPIDCLSLGQIKTGYDILATIEASIGGKKARSTTRSRAPVDKATGPSMHDTNKYYSLIPHSFGFQVPPKIDTLAKVEAERELLDALKGSIEASMEMKDLKKTASTKDIYHRLYERLPCQLTPVSEEISAQIGECLAMRGPTHPIKLSILDAFELKSPEELEGPKPAKRARKNAPKTTKRLLWHGTRVTNVFSILMNGLQMPEGNRCGLMFGNGVYFANVPTKSANYCCPEVSRRVFMLLCEVETGNPLTLYQSEVDADEMMKKAKKASVYAAGKHRPSETVEINGIPAFKSGLEQITEKTDLLYDEYVMFDDDQFKIKYVVEVKVEKMSAKEFLGR